MQDSGSDNLIKILKKPHTLGFSDRENCNERRKCSFSVPRVPPPSPPPPMSTPTIHEGPYPRKANYISRGRAAHFSQPAWFSRVQAENGQGMRGLRPSMLCLSPQGCGGVGGVFPCPGEGGGSLPPPLPAGTGACIPGKGMLHCGVGGSLSWTGGGCPGQGWAPHGEIG